MKEFEMLDLRNLSYFLDMEFLMTKQEHDVALKEVC